MTLEFGVTINSINPLIALNLASVCFTAHRALRNPKYAAVEEGIYIVVTDNISARSKRRFFVDEREALAAATVLLNLLTIKTQPTIDQQVNSLFLRYFKECEWVPNDQGGNKELLGK